MSTQMNESAGQRALPESSPQDGREAFGFGPADRVVGTADALVDGPWLDALLDRVDEQGLRLTGEGGFLPALVKAVLERGLAAELSDHLGYDKGDPAGRGAPNSRNGSTPKTVQTEVGAVVWTRRGTGTPASSRGWYRRVRGGCPEAWTR